ncbi:MAG: ATP cone domain-containing protein [Collinsella sp.]
MRSPSSIQKIIDAIKGANWRGRRRPSASPIARVVYAAQNVADRCESAGHTVSVEEIQDMVEDEIVRPGRF